MSLRFNHSGSPDENSHYELSNGQSLDINPGDSIEIRNPDDIVDLVPQGKDVLVLTKDGSSYLLKNFLLVDQAEIQLPDGTSINAQDFSKTMSDAHEGMEKSEARAVHFDIEQTGGSIALQSVTLLSIISQLSQDTTAFDGFALNADGSDNPTLRSHFQSVTLSVLATSNSNNHEYDPSNSSDSNIPQTFAYHEGSQNSTADDSSEESETSDQPASEKRSVSINVTDRIELQEGIDPNRIQFSSTVTDQNGEVIESETTTDPESGVVTVTIEIDEDQTGEQVDVVIEVVDSEDEDSVIDRDDFTIVLPNPFKDDTLTLSLSNTDVIENQAGFVIGQLDANGEIGSVGGNLEYSIIGDDSDLFEIVGNQLKLKDGTAIDFESSPNTYDLTIRIENTAGEFVDRNVSLKPADANDAPEVSDLSLESDEDLSLVFDQETFEQAFADIDSRDSLESIRIDSLPTNGTLLLQGTPVSIGQSIASDALSDLAFNPIPNWNGNTHFNWSGFDGDDYSAEPATVSIEVASINDAPIATFSLSTQTANEDALFSFTIPDSLFSDADSGDVLTLSATLPSWLSFDPETGEISGVPSYQNVGEHRIEITATDKSGAATTTSFNLSIENINDAPTFSPIESVSLTEKDDINIDAGSSFSDEDIVFGDSLQFSAELADGTELPEWLTINEATGRISGTPPQGEDTYLQIRVTATDSSDASVSTNFDLNISNINDAPELVSEIADTNALEDETFNFDISISFKDSDIGDELTFSATLPDGTELPSWLSFDPSTGTFSGVPENEDVGMVPVLVTARDTAGASVSDTFAIMVENTNDGPIAHGISNQTTSEDSGFQLNVADRFSDIDAGSILSFSATQTNGSDLPDWLEFDEATGLFSGTPTNEDVGELSIIVVASDGEQTVNSIFSIEVENTNDGPVAIFIPEQTAEEDSEFLFDASSAFSDIDAADELTYTATLENGDALPEWLTLNRFTGELYGTPTNSDVGSATITLTATDGEESASSNLRIEVNNTNDGPIIATSIEPQTTLEDHSFSLNISEVFDDIDVGDTLTYSATLDNGNPLPEWLSFNSETGEFSGTPENEDVGTISISVTADDGRDSATTTFSLEVENTNDGPVVWTQIEDQLTDEDARFSLDTSSYFADPDVGDTLSYFATLSDGSDLPDWLSINPDSGILSGTPGNGDVGTISVSVTATDNSGASTSSEFSIKVSNTNDAPIATAISDVSISEDSSFSLDISSHFSDIDLGDSLLFEAVSADGSPLPSWLDFDPDSGLFTGTPANGDLGTYSITVVASDGEEVVEQSFTIAVDNVNDSPVVTAQIVDHDTLEDSSFSLDVSPNFGDVDFFDTLTFSATLEDGSPLPGWLNFDSASGQFSGTPNNGDVGELPIKVTASDGSLTASDSFTLTVENTNDGPVVTTDIDSQTAIEDAAFTLETINHFSDEDMGDSLTFSATLADGSDLPSWLSIDPHSGTISGTPENNDVGSLEIKVIASDASGATAATNFSLVVENTNDGPTVSAISDKIVEEDSAFSFNASEAFDDVDAGDTLSYSATLENGDPLPEWLTFDSSSGTFSGTPENDDVGNIVVNVTATDQSEATATTTFSIQVSNTNDGPIAHADLASIEEDSSQISGNVLTNDVDVDQNDSLSVTGHAAGSYGSITIAPDGSFSYILDNSNPSVQSLGLGQSLTDTISYEISDESGATSTATVSVTISGTNDGISAVIDTDASQNSISEDAAAGDSTGITASALDIDANDSVSYSVDDPRFVVNSDGTVRVAQGASFDAETESSIELTVTATSTDGTTSHEDFTVNVADINEFSVSGITDTDASANTFAEDTTEGSSVGIVASASDSDLNDSVAYSVDDTRFTVDSSGNVRPAPGASFDSETEPSIDIVVTATSTDGSTSQEVFTIAVSDVDEFDVSTVSDSDSDANTISENATEGTDVGITATASDEDATDTVTYSIDDSRFKVDSNGTVKVASGASFDTETEPSIDVVVTATSTDGSTSHETFTIDVSDVDEFDVSEISDSDVTGNTVSEFGSDGDYTGITAFAEDADATNNTVSFSITSDPSGAFAVDSSTGEITLADASLINFESAQNHEIEVTATSSDGSTSVQSFTVSVTDENEAPTLTPIADQTTSEDSVFSLDTSAAFDDVDAGDTLTYTVRLADDSPAPQWLSIDPDTGILSGTPTNQDVGPVSIKVTATDTNGESVSDTFEIEVTNTNDGPVATTISDQSAIEDSSFSLDVTGNFSDVDDGDTLTFAANLTDGAPLPSWLSIDPSTGVLSGTPENGDVGDFQVTVTATDAAGASASETFSITVENTNDGPIAHADTASVDEDGAAISGNLIANDVDPDQGDSLSIAYVGTAAYGTLSVNKDGNYTYTVDNSNPTIQALGEGQTLTDTIEYDIYDESGEISTATLTVTINGTNDGISVVTDSNSDPNLIDEDVEAGTSVGITATATDVDTPDTITYSVDDARFSVDANGVVKVAAGASFDTETEPRIEITVTATSSDGSSSNETFNINVADVDEFDVSTISDNDSSANSISEAASDGDTVGVTAFAEDLDASQNDVTYSLSSNPSGAFAVDPDTGVVTVADASLINYEDAQSHTIEITATSADGSQSKQSYTIDVTDSDEFDVTAVTDTDSTSNLVAENASENDTVGITASAIDEDGSDSVNYSVDDARFTVDSNGVVKVAAGASFDTETEPTIQLTVTATSSDGSSSNETFTVNVADVDEFDVSTISDTDSSANSISEAASDGDTVGVTAFAEDLDATQNDVTYSLSRDPSGAFAVDPDTGVVTVADASLINYEDAQSHTIEITATSADGSESVQSFSVAVTNINEAPTVSPIADQTTDEDAAFSLDASAAFDDVDIGDTLTYSATLPDAGALPDWLSIDPDTGVLSGTPENGDVGSISVTVTATDAAGESVSDTFNITVENTNDGPVASAITDQTATEDTSFNLDVSGNFSDVDQGDSLSYTATLADDSPLPDWLTIDPVTGVLSGTPENGDVGQLQIKVTATDSEGATASETFGINIENTNDGPVAYADSASAQEDGASVTGNLIDNDIDPDNGDTLSIGSVSQPIYGTISVNKDGGFTYEVDHSNPAVQALGIGDTLTETVQYEIYDESGETSTSTLTITINGSNDTVTAVVDTDAAENTIDENAAGGESVGIVADASDADASDSVSYSVSDVRFTIDSNGNVTVADGASFDRETEPTIEITITATSSDGSTSNETFTVNVNDIDEYDVSTITDTNSSADAVDEDASAGTEIGVTASASDADATNNAISYSVDDERFTVDENGVIRVADGATFDAETDTSINVTVTATSQDGSTSTETFSVAVNDVDEYDVSNVSDIDDSADTIQEDAAAGTEVGVKASASDSDRTDTVTYFVDDARFSVDSDGTVKVAQGASFDAETESTVDITITATSSDGSTSNETFSISVSDIDEFDVSNVSDTEADANTVAENAAEGTTVGIVASASDADATDTVTYSIDDARFTVDSQGVVKVAAGASFDAETEDSIDVVVTATSSDGSTSNETFTISVSDIDEYDVSTVSDTNDSANSIDEDAIAGTEIGVTASASDSDKTDTVSYSVDDSRFTVDSEGVVTVAEGASFDAESESSINLTVTATSTDGSESQETFSINIADVNEFGVSAVSDSDPVGNSISEIATNGSEVGITALAKDSDLTNNSVTYSISNDPSGAFAIDASTGVVTLADASVIDFETSPEHTIEITATSSDGSTSKDSFTITVVDENEAPVLTPIDDQSVNEDSVFTLDTSSHFIDEDAGDSMTFVATLDDGEALPSWLSIDPDTGVLSGTPENDDVGSISIRVTATDSSGASASETFSISVANTNDAPVASYVADQSATEDAAFTFDVSGNFSDQDSGDALTYSATLEGGAPLPTWLSFDSTTGTFSGTPENDDVGPISVTVTATDISGATASETFGINVENTNDGPVVKTLSKTLWSEDFDSSANGETSGDTWSTEDLSASGNAVHGVENGEYRFSDTTDTLGDDASRVVFESDPIDISGQNSLSFSLDIRNTGSLDSSGDLHDYFNIYVSVEGTKIAVSEQDGAFSVGADGVHHFSLTSSTYGYDGEIVLSFEAKTTATEESYYIDNIQLVGSGAGLTTETALEDSAFSLDASLAFLDVDSGDSLSYTATLSNGDPLPSWLSINSTTGVLSGTPENGDVDSLSVTVTATDSSGASASDSFKIEVTNTNDGPIATAIDDQTANEDAVFSLDVSGNFSDVDSGDSLTFSATLANGDPLPDWLSIDETTGILSGTPENGDVDNYSVTVTATDTSGSSVSDTFSINVSNTNDAPEIAHSGLKASYFNLDFEPTELADIDFDSAPDHVETVSEINFFAGQDEVYEGGQSDNVGIRYDGTIHIDESGTWNFKVTGDDGYSLLIDGQEVVTVDGLHSSWAEEGSISLSEGEHSIQLLYFEAEGDSGLKLEWKGPNDSEYSVVDAGHLSSDISSTFADNASFTLDLSDSFHDEDAGDVLTFSATLANGDPLPDWMSIDESTGVLTGNPTHGDAADYELSVTATDSSGSSISNTISISVAERADLQGDGSANTLSGSDSDELIVGGHGSDTIDGGAGNDTIYGDDSSSSQTEPVEYIVNGSFEDVDGGFDINWGKGKSSVSGWTEASGQNFEMHTGNWEDMADATDGDYWLDMGGSPGQMDISQTVNGLSSGNSYTLSFDAGDRTSNLSNQMEVYFGGQLIATIDPTTSDVFESYSFEVTGGMGDGSNTLRFVEVGANDNWGVSLDNVSLVDTNHDTITGGAGDDTITGGAGNDTINGGDDTDTVVYSGVQADYTVTNNKDGTYTIADSVSGRDGTDTVSNVEYITFYDGTVAIDSVAEIALDEGTFLMSSGLVSIEAENYATNTDIGDDTWDDYSNSSFSDGEGVYIASGSSEDYELSDPASNSSELTYKVDFESAGTYYVWVRGDATQDGGDAASDDSLHIGLDGVKVTDDYGVGVGTNGLGWSSASAMGDRIAITVTEPGQHTINLWMREDGIAVDKLVITSDENYDPSILNSGIGPEESAREGIVDPDESYIGDGTNETIATGSGNDYIETGTGTDTVYSGEGDDTIVGSSSNETIYAEAGNDTIYTGGGSDTVDAGSGDDNIHIANGQSPYATTVDGGEGDDTLHFELGGYTLDFTTIDNSTVSNIERLNIDGSTNDRIKISASDVLDLTDGNNTLFIDGNSGDTVEISNSYSSEGVENVNGVDYNHYYDSSTDTHLYISSDITDLPTF